MHRGVPRWFGEVSQPAVLPGPRTCLVSACFQNTDLLLKIVYIYILTRFLSRQVMSSQKTHRHSLSSPADSDDAEIPRFLEASGAAATAATVIHLIHLNTGMLW